MDRKEVRRFRKAKKRQERISAEKHAVHKSPDKIQSKKEFGRFLMMVIVGVVLGMTLLLMVMK